MAEGTEAGTVALAHKWKEKRKKKVFFPFLMSLQPPSSPPTANTQTHTRGSQTLFESVHPLKPKRHAEAKEGS